MILALSTGLIKAPDVSWETKNKLMISDALRKQLRYDRILASLGSLGALLFLEIVGFRGLED
jgi:hypothetical protein